MLQILVSPASREKGIFYLYTRINSIRDTKNMVWTSRYGAACLFCPFSFSSSGLMLEESRYSRH